MSLTLKRDTRPEQFEEYFCLSRGLGIPKSSASHADRLCADGYHAEQPYCQLRNPHITKAGSNSHSKPSCKWAWLELHLV